MMRRGLLTRGLLFFGAALVGPIPAIADEPHCFDAFVSAKILRQTPTPASDCGDDCIVMSWPWILDLEVEHVLKGRAPTGRLTVLTVQHTYFRTGLGARRWWLRRNMLGGFNVLMEAETTPSRCAKDTPPAQPYVTPSEGQTLRDLRRDGERQYGPGPHE